MWGWGCAGARVSLNTNTNTSLATTVDTRGWWGLEVELEAGGPYTLTITQVGPGPVQVHHSSPAQVTAASRAEVVLGGVLAGAVWLCAGADNMALPVAGLANSTAEIEEGLAVAGVRCRGPAPPPPQTALRRYTRLPPTPAPEPQLELVRGLVHAWTPPSRATLPQLSATCWLFGRQLAARTGQPVGLVEAAVNRTDLWSWAPREAVTSACTRASLQNHTDARWPPDTTAQRHCALQPLLERDGVAAAEPDRGGRHPVRGRAGRGAGHQHHHVRLPPQHHPHHLDEGPGAEPGAGAALNNGQEIMTSLPRLLSSGWWASATTTGAAATTSPGPG